MCQGRGSRSDGAGRSSGRAVCRWGEGVEVRTGPAEVWMDNSEVRKGQGNAGAVSPKFGCMIRSSGAAGNNRNPHSEVRTSMFEVRTSRSEVRTTMPEFRAD